MKKLNTKFIASAVLAGIVAATMAVSSSAWSSYYQPPVYIPVDNDTSATTNTKDDSDTDEVDKVEPEAVSVVDEDTVKEAIKDNKIIKVSINKNGSAVLQAAALGAIVAADKPVTFEVTGNDIVYTVTINPKDITGEPKDIDLAMDIHVATANDGEGLEGYIYIGPEMKKIWSLSLGLTIPASALEGLNFDTLGLYYIDDNKAVTDYSEYLTKNSDGSVTVTLSHASAYVIADVDLTEGDVDAGLDIDDADDDDDVTIDEPSDNTPDQGKDNTSVVVNGEGTDTNPVTGTTLALGSLAVFAAAAVATSKKRK